MHRYLKSYCQVVSFIILSFLISNNLKAQYSNLKFENYSTTEGLSSSTVVEIFQDRDGFLWFGTIDGLNMFDGYEFKIFRPVINDLNSISSNRINSISEDHEGNLWVGTSNGLNVLNKNTGKFLRIDLKRENSFNISKKDVISDLFFDKRTKKLWIATKEGISRLDLRNIDTYSNENFKFQYFIHQQNDLHSIDNNIVTSIQEDNLNTIWIGTSGKYLNKYNVEQDNFNRIAVNVSGSYELGHIPKQVFIDKDGDIWIGNDLSKMVFRDSKTNSYSVKSLAKKSIPVFHIYQDNNGIIWFATDGYGIFFYDKENNITEHLVHNPDDPFSLPNNQPSKILEDKDGIFWIATYNQGVCKLDLSKSSFHYYFHQPGKKNSLSARIAQSVLQDSKNRIWIGTDGGGLNLFSENEKSFKHFRTNSNNPNSISSDKILYLLESCEGNIWVCTWDGGLNKFIPQTEKIFQYKHNVSDSFSIGQNTVWCAIEDSLNRLWVGTQNAGLNLMNPENNKFFKYKSKTGDTTSLISNFVFALFIDSHNRLFVGTDLGLCITELNKLNNFIPEQIEFRQIKTPGFQGSRVNYITEDNEGKIWVGTDIGLYTMDNELNLLSTYTTQQGLINNIILGIKEDDNGYLWITSKSGLSRLDPKSNTLKNFNIHDGLQGIEFQSKSIEKTNDGRIIIGGINGFNIFNPEDIPMGHDSVKPIITEFKMLNKTIHEGETVHNRILLKSSISNTKELILKYFEGYIAFEFVALYYQNPERVYYAYKMNGLDKEFIFSRTNRIANYSNLPPGDYLFEVKASIDGLWQNAISTTVNIKVLQPPWKTWWAYVIYIFILTGITWIALRYYTRKVREEKEHELDQMKLRFFINVSHEFRTPLTLILNPIDKILNSNDLQEVQASAQIIKRSASRLLNLVNQLLNFRKMDLGKTPLETVQGDITKFSKDIFMLFEDLARVKNIKFNFYSDISSLTTFFDPDKLEKIITNLLSNAIKYTNSGGTITLSVSKTTLTRDSYWTHFFNKNQEKDYVEIRVKDDGIGFRKEQLKDVFSRFFHIDNTKTGTGIGLNFTKSLVELHGGEILVESEFGKGSTFIVQLPVIRNRNTTVKDFSELKNYEFDINSLKSAEYEIAITDNSETSDKRNFEKETEQEFNEKNETILIIEDNKELRIHLKNELKNRYKVKEAINGADGWNKVQKYYPDIIISDVMMPEMDGFELCKKIKTDFDTCHIPVILLTARSQEEDRIEGYNTGADEYLPKPFNIKVLHARIKNLLEIKRILREKFSKLGSIVPSNEITSNSLDEAFLDKATKIVIENIHNANFSLENLLREIGYSRSQFYRKINSITGQNPSNFIRTIRLKYAAELLMKDTLSIKEVAYNCGFNSSAYFSKTFRELFGITPMQYIEKKVKGEE